MTYATLDQLSDRYGERMLVDLTDRADVATGVIDADVVARALSNTDSMIDGFLKDRYVLPLGATPPIIADVAQAIAIWKLHVGQPNDKIEKDYKEAVAMLDRIAKGTIRLDIAGVEPATVQDAGIRLTDRERPLTADNLRGYI